MRARPRVDAAHWAYAALFTRPCSGTVFLIFHKRTGEELVLKEVVLRGLHPAKLKSARAEVDVLRQLQHPHLIGYRASVLDEASQTLYIIMEFADGGDLLSKIEGLAKAGGQGGGGSPRFSEADVLKLTVQCSDAIAYCHHGLHLLHRDIKPANIFLTRSGDAKIGDFGISKSLAASHAQANTRCGSPVYMSPELCQAKPYDRSADAWAFGCTLYHTCALKPPWTDQATGGMVGLVRAICTAAVDLQSLRTHYSFALCGLLASLLSKAPAQRPSFKEVLALPCLRPTIDAERARPLVHTGAHSAVHREGNAATPAAPAVSSMASPPTPPPPAPRTQASPPADPPRPPSAVAPYLANTAATPAELTAHGTHPDTQTARRPPDEPTARGTEAHVAAAVLQRSFHRRNPSFRKPMGYSAAIAHHRAAGHNLHS